LQPARNWKNLICNPPVTEKISITTRTQLEKSQLQLTRNWKKYLLQHTSNQKFAVAAHVQLKKSQLKPANDEKSRPEPVRNRKIIIATHV
jgi:hypothetical protein